MLTVMNAPSPDEVTGAVTLITGSEEFLTERTIAAVRAAVRSADADADSSEVVASELGAGSLAEIISPSLFAAMRCVVVRGLEDVAADVVPSLVQYAEQPAADVALVLQHGGGAKGKGVLDKLRKAGVVEVKAQAPKRWELSGWVSTEFRSRHKRVDPAAAAALVDAVGEDMRALAGAVDQLVADSEDRAITEEMVRMYFGGRAEVKGFAVADAAIEGDTARAIEQLRWAFSTGVHPVLVTSAIAAGLRSLARYGAAQRAGVRGGDLAREVGVPPWKVKTLARQLRGWTPGGLAEAIQAAAHADAVVKGAGGDREWACERLVVAVLEARDRT